MPALQEGFRGPCPEFRRAAGLPGLPFGKSRKAAESHGCSGGFPQPPGGVRKPAGDLRPAPVRPWRLPGIWRLINRVAVLSGSPSPRIHSATGSPIRDRARKRQNLETGPGNDPIGNPVVNHWIPDGTPAKLLRRFGCGRKKKAAADNCLPPRANRSQRPAKVLCEMTAAVVPQCCQPSRFLLKRCDPGRSGFTGTVIQKSMLAAGTMNPA